MQKNNKRENNLRRRDNSKPTPSQTSKPLKAEDIAIMENVSNDRSLNQKYLPLWKQYWKNLLLGTKIQTKNSPEPFDINWSGLESLATVIILVITTVALFISFQANGLAGKANETANNAYKESLNRSKIEKVTYSMNPSLQFTVVKDFNYHFKPGNILKHNFNIRNFGESVALDVKIFGAIEYENKCYLARNSVPIPYLLPWKEQYIDNNFDGKNNNTLYEIAQEDGYLDFVIDGKAEVDPLAVHNVYIIIFFKNNIGQSFRTKIRIYYNVKDVNIKDRIAEQSTDILSINTETWDQGQYIVNINEIYKEFKSFKNPEYIKESNEDKQPKILVSYYDIKDYIYINNENNYNDWLILPISLTNHGLAEANNVEGYIELSVNDTKKIVDLPKYNIIDLFNEKMDNQLDIPVTIGFNNYDENKEYIARVHIYYEGSSKQGSGFETTYDIVLNHAYVENTKNGKKMCLYPLWRYKTNSYKAMDYIVFISFKEQLKNND